MKRKEKILHVAAKLFAHKGYMDTSVAEISKIANTAEGTLFYHFKTKEDLFIAVLESVRVELMQDFDEFFLSRPREHGLALLEGVIGYYLYLAATKEHAFLLIHRFYPHLMARENPRCREQLEAIYDGIVAVFERVILQGIEEGWAADVPVWNTALLMFNLVDGVARFRTYSLYETGVLYKDLIRSCRLLLSAEGRND